MNLITTLNQDTNQEFGGGTLKQFFSTGHLTILPSYLVNLEILQMRL